MNHALEAEALKRVREGLAANPALPAELVDRLTEIAVESSDEWLAQQLADRADLTRAQVLALAAADELAAAGLAYRGLLVAADVDPAARPEAALALLGEGAAGEQGGEWARLLVRDQDVLRRERLAACPDLPPDVVETLLADSEIGVVEEVALWTAWSAPAERLARHPHAQVRRAVAANEATSPVVLAALLDGDALPAALHCLVCDQEETPFVHDAECPRTDCELPAGARCDGSHESTLHAIRMAALENPATPAEAAVRFVDDPSSLIREAVAARADLPPDAGARLADDPIPGVRGDLAENPAIDEVTMRRLADDRSDDVRRRLAHNPRIPLDLLIDVAGRTRIGSTLLPRIAAATPAEIEELAESAQAAVRALLSERRDLPPDIRDALAADRDAKVVKSIAPHPGLSEARLRDMLARFGPQVAARAAANPDASPALLHDIAHLAAPPRRALQKIAAHPHATPDSLLVCLEDPRSRPLAAAHPSLPTDVLVSLLGDEDAAVAESAAANPSLPPSVMAELVRRGA